MSYFYDNPQKYFTQRLEAIYNRYFVIIHSIVKKYCFENADDVTADIFEKKIIKMLVEDSFTEEKDNERYIARIAKNYCIDYSDKNKSYRETLSAYAIIIQDSVEKPSLQIDQLMGELKSVLGSEDQYKVMLLTADGYKDKEIAEEMGRTVPAVRMLKCRARKKLRKLNV